ncbi:hypothetical protein ES703_30302 [subsurface metagenome]
MSKLTTFLVISGAVVLGLMAAAGTLIQAATGHIDTGGHKLIGVGQMGVVSYSDTVDSIQIQVTRWRDTEFIITNPNCDESLTIEWLALIAGDEVCCDWNGGGPCWKAGEIVWEAPPDGAVIPYQLGPHQVWHINIAELMSWVEGEHTPEEFAEKCELGKYTLEVTWSGAYYSGWTGWSRTRRPLAGWQRENCWSSYTYPKSSPVLGFATSEAEMKLYPDRGSIW